MAKNFTEIPCPFCHRTIRNTDKFCIFCGSKLNTQSPSQTASSPTDKEREEADKELKESIASKSEPEVSENKKAAGKSKKNRKKNKSEEPVIKEMPEEIKEQLDAKMQLAVVNSKKDRLRKRLKELTSELDSELYQYDLKYAKEINLKLNPVKEIKEELFSQEEQLREKLGPNHNFRMDELETTLEVQRQQLVELKRNYKRNKIKREVYQKLKEEYAEKYRDAENELQSLRNNVIQMLGEEKTKKGTYEREIQILKARMKAGEIEDADFESERGTLEKKIENVDQKIRILELYSEPRKHGFFK